MKIVVALIHMLFATVWLGGAVYLALVIAPALRTCSAEVRLSLSRRIRRVMVPMLGLAAVATIASGLVMMVELHPQHPGSFSHTHWGLALQVGAVVSVLELVLAIVLVLPSERKVETLLTGLHGEPEGEQAQRLAALSRRVVLGNWLAIAMLLFALATMAVARYS